ncbi:unnamed protein product [Alopecurus aequalis]
MGSTEGFVEIRPRELQFLFEVKKQSSCSIHLVNKTDEYVAFKVKTTSPKRYCVRPNIGVILPRATCVFTVIMQAQKTAPPDLQIKDKFLVQTTAIPYGTTGEGIIPAFFSKETGRYVEENKLRVVLVSATRPEAEQLISEIPDVKTAIEVPVAKETLNIVNEVPNVEDVENMKSELTNLEVKLKQAEILIIKLREEARTSIQERDKLRHEVLFRRKGGPRSQVGFPLLFVAYIAILGVSLGYLLHL